jgi:two-component system, NtrC family, nitrogen regulation sensor histidine kinase NtrY
LKRIRTRLILAFLAATIIPLLVTVWIMTSLLERSLDYATTDQLDRLSTSLQDTGRRYYQQARELLRQEVAAGSAEHQTFPHTDVEKWPADIREFWESSEPERFTLGGEGGSRLDYLVRKDKSVWVYSRGLGDVRMHELSGEYRNARQLVQEAGERDLRRGFTATLILLVASVWLVSLLWLIYLANRVSKPVQQLTAGLSELAAGRLDTRIDAEGADEIGRAVAAFNRSAAELEQSRGRLVYLTQIASWQALARKMAHELKNSLTPIRLTVEEILARQPEGERQFMEQAARIVVSEVESLERKVRAFSEFSSEPPLHLGKIDVNSLVEERVSLLKSGHFDVTYTMNLAANLPAARADTDRIKGILTNLLENGAQATGPGGQILARSYVHDSKIGIEIHDSGPGLSEEARRTLFEPTITFKQNGMGLGLSIARKDALMCGGDLRLIEGLLGGAGFLLTLPIAHE